MYHVSLPQVDTTTWRHTKKCIPTTVFLLGTDGRRCQLCYPRLCSLCGKSGFLRKRASPLKLLAGIEPLEPVTTDILEPLPSIRHSFSRIFGIATRIAKLIGVVLLRCIRSVDVAQAFLQHWDHTYGPPETLLSGNGKQLMYKFFRSVCHVLEINKCSPLQITHRPMGRQN